MIVVDASALLAIHLAEPERERFVGRILLANSAHISPVNYWEVLVRARAIDGEAGSDKVTRLTASLGITVAPMDAEDARAAAEAFARFGRRTPANLNLGDCFAYALARRLNAPLLFKGDDFGRTDVAAA